ncbi:putative Single-strand telomeric DNA-binding protein GBP2 [Balamuthia mandrillaris]
MALDLDSKLDMPLDEVAASSAATAHVGGGRFHGGGRGGATSSGPTCRVYCGNLDWSTSWQDLKDHMRKAGNVVRADVFLDEHGRSKGCGVVEYSTPEEAQHAINTLNDSQVAEGQRLIFVREDREDRNFSQAIQRGRGAPHFGGVPRGGAPYFGRGGGFYRGGRGGGRGVGRGGFNPFMGAPPMVPGGVSARGRQVFVGNLPYTTSWQDLKDHFRSCGNVQRADVLMEGGGRPKGQGIVLFETAAEAQKAIATFDSTEFQGRLISVHEDKFAQ